MGKTTGISWETPNDRLTGIADAMLDTLEDHPKRTHATFAIIILIDEETDEAATAVHGFDEPWKALPLLLEGANEIAKLSGGRVIGIPFGGPLGGGDS